MLVKIIQQLWQSGTLSGVNVTSHPGLVCYNKQKNCPRKYSNTFLYISLLNHNPCCSSTNWILLMEKLYTGQLHILFTHSHCLSHLHRLEEVDVIHPDLIWHDVHANFLQGKIICLRHFLSVWWQCPLGLFDVAQVQLPEINVQNFDQATLEKLAPTKLTEKWKMDVVSVKKFGLHTNSLWDKQIFNQFYCLRSSV